MKRFLILAVSILFLGITNLVLAQSNTSPNTKNPNAHEVHKKLRDQIRQIQQDLKSGKITESEAKTRRENLRSVHEEEKQFRHQNGGKDLTASQANQLKASLDKNGVQN
jgi:hypothetical protein